MAAILQTGQSFSLQEEHLGRFPALGQKDI